MDGEEPGGRGRTVERIRSRPHGGVVVVARGREPHRALAHSEQGAELGRLMDDAFAGMADEAPGRFDAVLAVAGAILVAWAWLGAAGGPWLALGLVLVALGTALPVSHLIRTAHARRRAGDAEPAEAADAGH